jgi:Spy/CpxP family protein refolding chaperone
MDPQTNSKTKLKAAFAAVILFGALLFVYAQFKSNTASTDRQPEMAQAANRQQQGRPDGPPSEDKRKEFRQQMIENLDLTEEQQAKMKELREEAESSGEGRRGMMQAMREVLTPEQQQKARSGMQNRMRQRMSRNANLLPPDEQKKLAKKIEERLQDMEERIASGDFPPGGPGGPGGPGRGK